VIDIEGKERSGQYAVKVGLCDRLTTLHGEEYQLKTKLIGQTWKQFVLFQF